MQIPWVKDFAANIYFFVDAKNAEYYQVYIHFKVSADRGSLRAKWGQSSLLGITV